MFIGSEIFIFQSYGTNDLLNRSAWNAIIHQPSQDSEPEDLPSTVDMDAIKVC